LIIEPFIVIHNHKTSFLSLYFKLIEAYLGVFDYSHSVNIYYLYGQKQNPIVRKGNLKMKDTFFNMLPMLAMPPYGINSVFTISPEGYLNMFICVSSSAEDLFNKSGLLNNPLQDYIKVDDIDICDTSKRFLGDFALCYMKRIGPFTQTSINEAIKIGEEGARIISILAPVYTNDFMTVRILLDILNELFEKYRDAYKSNEMPGSIKAFMDDCASIRTKCNFLKDQSLKDFMFDSTQNLLKDIREQINLMEGRAKELFPSYAATKWVNIFAPFLTSMVHEAIDVVNIENVAEEKLAEEQTRKATENVWREILRNKPKELTRIYRIYSRSIKRCKKRLDKMREKYGDDAVEAIIESLDE